MNFNTRQDYITPNGVPVECRSVFSINECLNPERDNIVYIDKSYTLESFRDEVYDIITEQEQGPEGIDNYSWKSSITNQMSYGNMLTTLVSSMMGKLWSCRAVDFGSQFYVETRFNNYQSGLTASASFLVLLKDPSFGVVKQSSARWKTVKSLSDALAYIVGKARPISTRTTTL